MLWKIPLVLLGLLVGLVLVAVIVGLFVPKRHVASRRVRYAQPAETIWATITDFEHHPAWRPGLREVRRLDDRDGKPVWQEVRGRGDTLGMMVVELDPPRRLVTQVVDNRSFGGTWTWEVEPLGESACALTITEHGEIYNPFFRFVARFVVGYRGTMDGLHRALAAKVGETIELPKE